MEDTVTEDQPLPTRQRQEEPPIKPEFKDAHNTVKEAILALTCAAESGVEACQTSQRVLKETLTTVDEALHSVNEALARVQSNADAVLEACGFVVPPPS